ncbi:hypothetical protein COLU111180_10910 [Cohnella lubricantis]|uniref:YfhD family protein n=1 Tax=Cohnella lubricantis TaxID=2163172 RepID=A0A841TBA9_9BACL|nr:hypothetical protein [Cohnella lubricantis]MBB6678292.1 hypothetical protein [Cohnella lubricantis]MBP2118494.1 hypothetical protein [Cohnella lubricantis]
MANRNQKLSKGEVQSTELNKMPVPGEDDTEFSAEEAAEAFEQNANRQQNEQDHMPL